MLEENIWGWIQQPKVGDPDVTPSPDPTGTGLEMGSQQTPSSLATHTGWSAHTIYT